jgi:hypothetical protein
MKFMFERFVDSWKNIKITIKSLTQGGGGGRQSKNVVDKKNRVIVAAG